MSLSLQLVTEYLPPASLEGAPPPYTPSEDDRVQEIRRPLLNQQNQNNYGAIQPQANRQDEQENRCEYCVIATAMVVGEVATTGGFGALGYFCLPAVLSKACTGILSGLGGFCLFTCCVGCCSGGNNR
jgi:hypothetical protein